MFGSSDATAPDVYRGQQYGNAGNDGDLGLLVCVVEPRGRHCSTNCCSVWSGRRCAHSAGGKHACGLYYNHWLNSAGTYSFCWHSTASNSCSCISNCKANSVHDVGLFFDTEELSYSMLFI